MNENQEPVTLDDELLEKVAGGMHELNPSDIDHVSGDPPGSNYDPHAPGA